MSQLARTRRALGRLRGQPALLLAGCGSAAATVLAIVLPMLLLDRLELPTYRTMLLVLLAWLLCYDLVLAATKPAVLPGLYALARTEERVSARQALGIVGERARAQYRPLAATVLRARLVGVGYSVLFAPVVLAVVGTLATAASVLGYWSGALAPPPSEAFTTGIALLLVAVWFLGKWPTALAEPLALAGHAPEHAWRASARRVWEQPRRAGALAAARLGLGAVAFVIFFGGAAVLPDQATWALLATLAVMLAVCTVTKSLEGVLLADLAGEGDGDAGEAADATGSAGATADRFGRGLELPGWLTGSTARTVLVVLLVAGLLLGSGWLRVADVRPGADAGTPTAATTDDPDEYYAVARSRTADASRAVTVDASERNWTRPEWEPALRARYAVDFEERRGAVDTWGALDNGSRVHTHRAFLTDGLYASTRDHSHTSGVLDRRTVDGYTVSATPEFADFLDALPVAELPAAVEGWAYRERGGDRVVVAIEDPDAVAALTERPYDEHVEYREESEVVVRIDPETQRVASATIRERFVVYESAERSTVEHRLDRRRELTYAYEDLPIERPDAVDPYPLEYVWDAIYY